MDLQHIIFPATDICTEEQMYFRRSDNIVYQWTEDAIYINRFGMVSFDTYFNSFSAEKWFKYTTLETVKLKIKVRGVFRITLVQKQLCPNDSQTRFLSEHICGKANEYGEYSYAFNSLNEAGIFYFSLLAMEDGCVFYGGAYESDVKKEAVKHVKLGVVICTYNREKMVTRNVKRINEKLIESKVLEGFEIFVVDNAKTLNKADFPDKIRLYHNKNTGGAGGFTRGIIEVLKLKEKSGLTHVILNDDDIVLDPEVLFTTYSLLCILKEEYKDAFIGGAMLSLNQQFIQTESGAVWNNGQLISLKAGLDLRLFEACGFNEIEEKTDYNAWWYCTMPLGIINEQNLPMPLFIRGDDIEYGLRNMKHLILLNRLCVWHEPFENKYSSAIFYYVFRNMLINNALHMKSFKKYEIIKSLLVSISREAVFYRFKNCRLIIRGVSDFFKGTAWLKAQDGEGLHKELTEYGYCLQYIEKLEMPFSYPLYEQSLTQKGGGIFGRIFRVITFNGLFFPANKDVVVSVSDSRPINFFRAKRALNFDFNSKKGFVTHKSIRSTLSCLWGIIKISIKIIFCSKKAALDYKNNGSELMKIDFWRRYLEL